MDVNTMTSFVVYAGCITLAVVVALLVQIRMRKK
jgi:hypothetical protein